ncbi:MAG: nucleoside monophosphate kinase [Chloroflexota bacterium]|nr:nucleoside monophosphate kinase [Chloroflexota bacterium]
MQVILMGAQGSGKGTQAAILSPAWALEKIATGDLFRTAIAEGDELGTRVKVIYDRGELIPDEITIALVRQRLHAVAMAQADEENVRGALYDGFPRTRPQAAALDEALEEYGERVDVVIEIAVPLDILIARLAGRRVCAKCGAIYHIAHDAPKREGICDLCGGELIQREDDRPGPIRRRLSTYFAETEPLLMHYRERGLLRVVNGDQTVESVTAAINRELNLLLIRS